MTVAIPEASAAARTSAQRTPARQSRPTPAQMSRQQPAPRQRTPRQPPPPRQRGPQQPPPRQRPPRQRGPQPPKGPPPKRPSRGRAGIRGGGGGGTPGHDYQAIIAAEFIAASLLVALTPISSRKARPSGASGKLSPYVPGDIIQLFALGIVYMILEGIASGRGTAARWSAWFGFLILITVGLYELSRIAAVFKMLAGRDVNAIQLTGTQAPVTKGESPIPPLGQGPPPKGKG